MEHTRRIYQKENQTHGIQGNGLGGNQSRQKSSKHACGLVGGVKTLQVSRNRMVRGGGRDLGFDFTDEKFVRVLLPQELRVPRFNPS